MKLIATFSTLLACLGSGAKAASICTLIANGDSDEILLQTGDCTTRVTPASTFKIPLALMGYDTGILQDAHNPTLPFRTGYADWGGENWRQPTDPQRWMAYSVVWYSRQITPLLGVRQLAAYASAFDYGNADFSGDYGQSNGLERAWMTSSLKISPAEQVRFLSRMNRYDLLVSRQAVDATRTIVTSTDTPEGWRIQGKAGTAYPRQDSGSFDYSKGWGWFVGWAERGDTRLVFAHLLQDEQRHPQSPGQRAKLEFINNFNALMADQ